MDPRAVCMLGKCSITDQISSPVRFSLCAMQFLGIEDPEVTADRCFVRKVNSPLLAVRTPLPQVLIRDAQKVSVQSTKLQPSSFYLLLLPWHHLLPRLRFGKTGKNLVLFMLCLQSKI